MIKGKKADVVIRPKRQVTIPRDICDKLGVRTGDVLELSVEDSVLVAKPRKNISLESLKEIRKAFQLAGITEKELKEEGRRVRSEIAGERHGSRD
jgi:AbrB family looped-hinge helix DNA binding protein